MAEYDDEVFDMEEDGLETDTTDSQVETDTSETLEAEQEPEFYEDQPEPETVETEEPTEIEEPIPEGVDNPKSYKHFQRLAQERYNQQLELEKQNAVLQARIEEIDKRQGGGQPPEVEAPAPEPQEIRPPQEPVKPANYDEVDALTAPSSESYRYRVALEDYGHQERKYLRGLVERQEQERIRSEEERIVAQNKARILGDFQKQGLDRQASERALNFFASPDSVKPDVMVKFFQWYEGQSQPQQPPRKEKLNTPLPVGVTSAQSEQVTKTPDDAFNEQLGREKRDWGI